MSRRILTISALGWGLVLVAVCAEDLAPTSRPALKTETPAPVAKLTPPAPNPSQPLSPEQSLAQLKTPPDLELRLVLAEPTVAQPVFLNFDERGRMWVVEYLQYPAPAGLKALSHDVVWRAVYDRVPDPPPHHVRGADKISIHEDTNGDGTFDKHTIFVEGLNICTAVCRGRNGVWILNPPYLLFYPDKDNNDVPDGDPAVHLAGFGLEDTHSVVNSLCWGPDGWLYAAQGSTVSGDVVRPGLDKTPVHSLGQLIWRYHPENKLYEIFSEGGGNAFGCEIDAKGRIFSGHNGGDTRGFHYQQGAYLQKGFQKHGPLSNPFAFGYFPAMKHPAVPRFTHTFTFYDAAAFPEKYRGQLFGVAPLLNYIVAAEMTSDGSTFQTQDRSFPVTSGDTWFRPVDIKLGPDGALYVADWYDGQVAHLRSAEGAFDKSNGRIYRLQAKGAAPARFADLGRLSTAQLVELLKSDNRWVRQTALRLLGDRRDPAAIPLVRKTLEQRQVGQLALESLWALHQSGGLDEAETSTLLEHPDPFVRLWAIRLACDDKQAGETLVNKLAELARSEPNLEVRSQLACSARRLPAVANLRIVEQLLTREEDATDPRQPLLLWWAIESACENHRDLALRLFAEPTVWKLPLVQQHLTARLMRRFAAAGTRRDLLTCAELFALAPAPDDAKRLMAGFEEAFQGRSLAALPRELIDALARAGGGSLLLRVRQGNPEALQSALRALTDSQKPLAERLELARVFGEVKHAAAIAPLLEIAASARGELELRQAAIASLQAYDDPAIGTALLAAYAELPDELHAAAQTLFAGRPVWTRQFLAEIAAGRIAAATVPPEIVRKMLLRPDEQIAAAVRKHWGEIAGATTAEMRAQVAQWDQSIRSGAGDPYRGQALYERQCANCHALFGKGGQIGPDLTGYQRADIPRMLLNIINPSAEIREGYENYAILTNDGRALNGFLADQDNQVVTLRGGDGQNVTIPRDNIDELRRLPLSLMPEGMMKSYNEQQVRDLFAYLRITQPLIK